MRLTDRTKALPAKGLPPERAGGGVQEDTSRMTPAEAPRNRSTQRQPRPAVQAVTSAQPSRPQEIDERRRRYLITMGLRIGLFLAAVFLFSGWLRWGAIAFSFIAPYVAVVVANAGPHHTRDTTEYTGLSTAGGDPKLPPGRTIDM